MADLVSKLRAAIEASEPDTQAQFSDYRDNPAEFASEVLGVTPHARQAELMQAVADHDRLVVPTGHRTGKSTAIACMALWWTLTRPLSRVLLFAPKHQQTKDVLWREVRRIHRGAKQALGGLLHENPQAGLVFPDGRQIIGMSLDTDGERLQGFASPHLLLMIDEAAALDELTAEAVFSNLAGGGRLVLSGNPTRRTGPFYSAWESSEWHKLRISSTEVAPLGIPGLATEQWCRRMAHEWGEQSAIYSARVAGIFPRETPDSIFSVDLIEQARARWDQMHKSGDGAALPDRLECGLDPALRQDEAGLAMRRGPYVFPIKTWRQIDTQELVARVLAAIDEVKRPGEDPILRVDVCGLGGPIYDLLKTQEHLTVIPINAGENAGDDRHNRLRDRLVMNLRDFLKAGGTLPPDNKLEGELSSMCFSVTPSGKLQVTDKLTLRAALGRSPDRMDSAALCVYAPDGAPLPDEFWEALPRSTRSWAMPAGGPLSDDEWLSADGDRGEASDKVVYMINGERILR